MKNVERSTALVGLLLLAAFFMPYVIKLKEIDLGIILLGGLALAAYDFFTSHIE